MTLAVMTRATRGHTGRTLTAPSATAAVYLAVAAAALARIAAALVPDWSTPVLVLAALAWSAGFADLSVFTGQCSSSAVSRGSCRPPLLATRRAGVQLSQAEWPSRGAGTGHSLALTSAGFKQEAVTRSSTLAREPRSLAGKEQDRPIVGRPR